jgi:hypothetical protein
VDLDRNLLYVDHLPSLTFDLLQNLLGGRCKSVARSSSVAREPAVEAAIGTLLRFAEGRSSTESPILGSAPG